MGRKQSDSMMEGDVRRESSIPVQSRINIVELAKMCLYWENVEGVSMDSMSKLVSWSVSALCNLLKENEKIPDGIESIADAHNYLTEKGLYQRSLKARSMRKISTAMSFESLRKGGIDTREYVPQQHSMVNNKHSIEPFDGGSVYEGVVNVDDVEMARKMIERQRAKDGGIKVEVELSEEEKKEKEDRLAELQRTIKDMKNTGRLGVEGDEVQKNVLRSNMTDRELDEYNKAREEEVRARENASVDLEEIMRLQEERAKVNEV